MCSLWSSLECAAQVIFHASDLTGSRILWVALQIDAIWDCATDREIRHALEDLPKDLNETYYRCASRIKKPLGPRILSYICATLSPFQIAELQEFLAIDPTTGRILRDNIPQERSMIQSCAGLATRTEDDLVLPTHHSVIPFLEKSKLLLEMHEGKFDTEKSRLILGELCVRHLTGPDYRLQVSARESKITMEIIPVSFLQAPLLPNLFKIPRLFDTKKRTPIQFDASLATALRKPEPQISYLNAFRYARANWPLLTRQISSQSSSWQWFKELVLEKRLSWNVFPWSPSGRSLDSHYQDLLGWATACSHAPMLHVLLHESNPEPRKEIFDLPLPQYEDQLPLELAVFAKSTEILERLLPRCTQPKLHRLMFLAAKTGFVDAVDALKYPDYYTRDNLDIMALLSVAAQSGQHEFVARLFRAPFQLDAFQILPTLAIVSEAGNCSMLHTILQLSVHTVSLPSEEPFGDSHSRPKLPDETFKRPLLAAVKSDHIDVVQILFSYGAKIDYSDTWPTVLNLAIENENLDMVQLLLQRGANRDLCPIPLRSLDLAVKKAHFPITQLLFRYEAGLYN